MPKRKTKTTIDYSTTIIYKITCKDTNIKELYVGHTTNFVQRRQAHKQECINNNACKLYAIIREHGGWNNWIMEIVHFFTCNDQYEARTKEQEYFVLLKATLNSIEPMPSPKPKPNINVIENDSKFHCNCCAFRCNKNSNYLKHLSTPKHNKMTKNDNFMPKNADLYICNNCNKCYKYRQGLSLHKNKCQSSVPSVATHDASNNFVLDKELVMLLIKENNELKNMLIEEHKSTQQIMLEVIKNVTNSHKTHLT